MSTCATNCIRHKTGVPTIDFFPLLRNKDNRLAILNELKHRPAMNTMKYPAHVIHLLRPHQWVKNGFVLFPVFFANRITDPEIWPALTAAFFSFCLVSSAIYIFNDIRDIEFDRKHPTKRNRPLAKGVVSQTMALCIMGLAAISGFCLAALCAGFETMLVIFGYAALNILYSLRIKRIAILDIISIATGFVLRLEAGSFATSIELSHWIVLMTFLLAMFLALAKRRSELILALRGNVTRDSLKGYSLEFLSAAMVLMAGITVVCYIMWTVSRKSSNVTAPTISTTPASGSSSAFYATCNSPTSKTKVARQHESSTATDPFNSP